MAVDVSSLVRKLNGYNKEEQQPSVQPKSGLITRDLLGGAGGGGSSSSRIGSKELDLDLHVPYGWEKRLDLKSGDVYLRRCMSSISSTATPSSEQEEENRKQEKLQDLNFPPAAEEERLELKLFPDNNTTGYQSVCTLDKVKSALERAEKQSSCAKKKEEAEVEEKRSSSLDSSNSSGLFAGGCPGCLMYVLISKSDPKCPRCHTIVPSPSPGANKKPRIDLNAFSL